MNAKTRLANVQTQLRNRGVRDVKFCFVVSPETVVEDVLTDMADLLESHVAGRCRVAPPLNDSHAVC